MTHNSFGAENESMPKCDEQRDSVCGQNQNKVIFISENMINSNRRNAFRFYAQIYCFDRGLKRIIILFSVEQTQFDDESYDHDTTAGAPI